MQSPARPKTPIKRQKSYKVKTQPTHIHPDEAEHLCSGLSAIETRRGACHSIANLGETREETEMGIVDRHCRYVFIVPCDCAPRLKLKNDIQSVNDTRNVTEDGQQDVDEEISIAATLEEDTQRWEDDGKKDLADIACGERHGGKVAGGLFWRVCW